MFTSAVSYHGFMDLEGKSDVFDVLHLKLFPGWIFWKVNYQQSTADTQCVHFGFFLFFDMNSPHAKQ